MTQVLLCGAAIVTLSMGIRHGFGLWLQPITMDRGWTRETFAFALAVQNLAWGLAGPLAGMLADRFGAFRVLLVGGVLYALGLVLMALAAPGLAFTGQRRAADRHGAVGLHLRRGLRRDRAQRAGRQALLGDGRGGGGRLVRPVPDGAGGELADRPHAAGRTRCSSWAARRWHPAAGVRPEGAAAPRPHAAHSRAWRRRCARPSPTPASGC